MSLHMPQLLQPAAAKQGIGLRWSEVTTWPSSYVFALMQSMWALTSQPFVIALGRPALRLDGHPAGQEMQSGRTFSLARPRYR